jgi:hypothetical protein
MTQPEKSYSRDDALRDLRAIQAIQDDERNPGRSHWEEHHSDADDILLKLIGDPEITRKFAAISKWYA